MPFQNPPRPPSVLASVLAAAGIVLAVASCSTITPLGPSGPSSVAPPAVPPPPLRSPFILEAVRIQASASAGGCPSGSVALSGGPGQCYRQLGTPVTITSAYVGSVVTGTSRIPPGQYGFWVTLPAADLPALHALTTAAYDAQGFLGISVAGQTWLLPRVRAPFTGPLEMVLPAKDQVLLLHRLLFPSPVAHVATAVASPGT
ncbi:MAG: hypothetical protein WAL72_25235 [Streptosporangiaceae bacterium]